MMVTADYDIELAGELPAEYVEEFGTVDVTVEHGRTTLHGRGLDQAALRGIIDHTADLGLTLLGVTRIAR